MIKISADHIKNKLGFPYYLILGSDPYLKYYAQNELKYAFKQAGFDEQFTFVIDNQTDWQKINDSCQAMSLFSSQTLIFLDFGDSAINSTTNSRLNALCERLSPDVALIMTLNKLSKAQENASWYQALSNKLVIVNCITPDMSTLPQWLKNYLLQHELSVDLQSIELLCHFYEGNLLALTQAIDQLKLLYPSHKMSYAQIEQHIHDASIFTPYHWIDAMVSHKSKRAIHILQQLKINDVEPLILLRVVQRELILLINLKKTSTETSFKHAFDEYKVWQNRRQIYSDYLARSDIQNLYHTLSLLTDMEIQFKTDYNLPIWNNLSSFTLQFMGINAC